MQQPDNSPRFFLQHLLVKNTPSAVSASDPGPGGEPLGKQVHEMAEPVPTSGWVFFLAGSNITHPSVSQSFPICRGKGSPVSKRW